MPAAASVPAAPSRWPGLRAWSFFSFLLFRLVLGLGHAGLGGHRWGGVADAFLPLDRDAGAHRDLRSVGHDVGGRLALDDHVPCARGELGLGLARLADVLEILTGLGSRRVGGDACLLLGIDVALVARFENDFLAGFSGGHVGIGHEHLLTRVWVAPPPVSGTGWPRKARSARPPNARSCRTGSRKGSATDRVRSPLAPDRRAASARRRSPARAG